MGARARAATAIAGAAAVALALTGCVGGDRSGEPSGPNGYTLGTTIGDMQVWYDVGEVTGATDVILVDPAQSQPVGSCLGGSGTACRLGSMAEQPYAVLIAPVGASAQVTWNGEAVDMTVLEPLTDEAPAVYVAAVPAVAEGTEISASYRVLDDAGAVVFEQ